MIAEILAVGTELLMGQIANTNAQYITSKLQEAGVDIYIHTVVGDNPNRLSEMLKLSLSRSDIVIMTGGLGPTKDDLTKETVANYFGKKLVPDQESLKMIKDFFNQLGRELTQNNLKQADMPEGCIVLKNNNGTAPGCIIEENGKAVVMLPGPPSEMMPLFDQSVMPWLMERSGYQIYSKYLKVSGIGESKIEDMLIDLIEAQTNPTIAPYVKDGVVTLRVTAKCKDSVEGEKIIAPLLDEVLLRLGDSVFSIENESLAEVVARLLIAKGMNLSVAESCSGGMLSSLLVDLPGASQYFERGFITYSNQAKVDELGVDPSIIEHYGAVSDPVAKMMVDGAAKASGTQIALSITGIAGPDGGTDDKPIGLVYVGIHTPSDTYALKLQLWGNRSRIRHMATLSALNILRKYLLQI